MSKIERIEQEIQGLSAEELAKFRDWFLEFSWEAWDRQLDRDVQVGKLDSLAEEALREHASGKTKPL